MAKLVVPVSKYYIRKKEALFIWVFSLFPLLLIVQDFMGVSFMEITAENSSVSFLEFLSADLSIQFNMILPLMAVVYFVCTCIHDENVNGYLFLYKDVSRTAILNAKLIAFTKIIMTYFALSTLTSFITYFGFLSRKFYSSNQLISNSVIDNERALLTILSVILTTFVILFLAIFLSLILSNGLTLMVSISYGLLSIFLPQTSTGIRYLTISAYVFDFSQHNLMIILIFMTGVMIVYGLLLYSLSINQFKKFEY